MADTVDLLRDVLARLDALETLNAAQAREIDTLKEQNATLLARVERSSPPDNMTDESHGSPLERMSRRWVLQRGMQAAAATIAAGVLMTSETQTARASATQFGISEFDQDCEATFCPAEATIVSVFGSNTHPGIYARSSGHDHNTMHSSNQGGGHALYGQTTSDDRSAVVGENFGSDAGIYGRNHGTGAAIRGVAMGSGGTGVHGTGRYGVMGETGQAGFDGVFGRNNAASGNGVRGVGGTGVKGTSSSGIGVWGEGLNGVYGSSSTAESGAVYGRHFGNGYGVVGDTAAASLPGVLGRNAIGAGVKGEGGFGVWGVGNFGVIGESSANGQTAVWGKHNGTGPGVVGDGKGAYAGVIGRNSTNTGVRGEGRIGGTFIGQSTGYGAVIQGGKAQLRLVPGGSAGAPAGGSHQRGELYLDSAGDLWVCKTGGTPGTWRKVSTTVS